MQENDVDCKRIMQIQLLVYQKQQQCKCIINVYVVSVVSLHHLRAVCCFRFEVLLLHSYLHFLYLYLHFLYLYLHFLYQYLHFLYLSCTSATSTCISSTLSLFAPSVFALHYSRLHYSCLHYLHHHYSRLHHLHLHYSSLRIQCSIVKQHPQIKHIIPGNPSYIHSRNGR